MSKLDKYKELIDKYYVTLDLGNENNLLPNLITKMNPIWESMIQDDRYKALEYMRSIYYKRVGNLT